MYQIIINDYKFFDNEPSKYIFSGSDNDGLGFITRFDTLAFNGFLIFPSRLSVSGSDTSIVYANFGNVRVKSFDGGISWPEDEEFHEETIPDSLILDFPLISLSPYDDHLMFGIRFRFGADDNAFLRSTDAGITTEVLSDTLFPNKKIIGFDADSNHVYLIDTMGVPDSDINCSIDPCLYGFYRSSERGAPESWELKKIFNTQVEIEVNRFEKGEMYVWDSDTIFVSTNFGEAFDVLFHSESEDITGVVAEGDQIFISTTSSLYEFENGSLHLVREIPVSAEQDHNIPSNVQLHQNYPNPFNPVTVISYQLPVNSDVTLEVYDMLGRRFALLVDGVLAAGSHEVTFDASNLASGVYLYRLSAGQFVQTRQMVLVK